MGGWPGLDFQTWDYAYDVEPTIMTHSATRAIGEISRNPSHYRAEQYDSDLGLYYLRARYYNPLTGRFLSRDPEDGEQVNPKTLHKYLYADGDPINAFDASGREALFETGKLLDRSTRQTAIATAAFRSLINGAFCLIIGGIEQYANIRDLKDPVSKPLSFYCYITTGASVAVGVGLLVLKFGAAIAAAFATP
jgi:RHS repeat-associated protein